MPSRHYIFVALGGTLCASGTALADHAAAEHHTNREVQHGEVRPAVLGESPQTRLTQPPEHPEHEVPHDARETTEHPDLLHHGALDHDPHYHGSFAGYPNYRGRALDGAQPMVLSTRPEPLTKASRLHHFGGGASATVANAGDSMGYGALLRARGHLWEGELELAREQTPHVTTSFGKASQQVSKTSSTRAGGSIYLNLLHHSALRSYLVAGGGMRFPEKSPQKVYAEGGAGLGLSLSTQIDLSADIRYSYGRFSPATADQRGASTRFLSFGSEQEPPGSESALAFRLAAIFYW